MVRPQQSKKAAPAAPAAAVEADKPAEAPKPAEPVLLNLTLSAEEVGVLRQALDLLVKNASDSIAAGVQLFPLARRLVALQPQPDGQ